VAVANGARSNAAAFAADLAAGEQGGVPGLDIKRRQFL